jgi:hypothetical protein
VVSSAKVDGGRLVERGMARLVFRGADLRWIASVGVVGGGSVALACGFGDDGEELIAGELGESAGLFELVEEFS